MLKIKSDIFMSPITLQFWTVKYRSHFLCVFPCLQKFLRGAQFRGPVRGPGGGECFLPQGSHPGLQDKYTQPFLSQASSNSIPRQCNSSCSPWHPLVQPNQDGRAGKKHKYMYACTKVDSINWKNLLQNMPPQQSMHI